MPTTDATTNTASPVTERAKARTLGVDYARGVMGGMLVGVPVMMTMEMWWEGFFVATWKLALLMAVNFGVLLILQHFSGLTRRKTRRAEVRAAVVAYGIGIVVSATVLLMIGVLRASMEVRDVAGKLAIQSVPVSIGSSVAMSAFGEEHRVAKHRRKRAGYWGALGMALAGAMLFGFAASGTEEILLIADQLSALRAVLLLSFSLVQVYAVVYAVDFKERSTAVGTPQHLRDVWRETVSTYALSLAVGAYLLWTFQTMDSRLGIVAMVYATITIGFVTSLGASAAELLI